MMKRLKILLACLLLSAACKGEEISLKSDDFEVRLHAKFVDAEKARKIAPCGYSTYQGKIYRAIFDVPYSILESAAITLDGKRIDLPASGIADFYVKEVPLTSQHVLKESLGDSLYKVSIYFAKGGAEDFVASWVVNAELEEALFVEIVGCGDQVPQWYEKRMSNTNGRK